MPADKLSPLDGCIQEPPLFSKPSSRPPPPVQGLSGQTPPQPSNTFEAANPVAQPYPYAGGGASSAASNPFQAGSDAQLINPFGVGSSDQQVSPGTNPIWGAAVSAAHSSTYPAATQKAGSISKPEVVKAFRDVTIAGLNARLAVSLKDYEQDIQKETEELLDIQQRLMERARELKAGVRVALN